LNAFTLNAVRFSGIVNFTSPNMKSPSILLSIVAAVSMTFGISTSTVHAQVCAGDVNGDHVVDGRDLAVVLGNWGSCSGPTWATVLEWEPNPAVVTDANLRAAIVASGFAWRIRDNSSNIEMLLVPAGTFPMGCSPDDADCLVDESPAHQVTLTNAFYIGKTEVTQAQWQAKMGNNPSYFVAGNGYPGSPDRPVEQVSWNTIQSFNSATGLRLPTEAEWEFACRAGTTNARYGVLNDIAWNSLNTAPTTNAVATKLPNALGVYDMLGNVCEWCQDYYGPYSSDSVTNPTGPATGSTRALRGGAWRGNPSFCRASQRGAYGTDVADLAFGFRVVRNP
jgi:formylglycine-generating enzyme required for sulfatase activity